MWSPRGIVLAVLFPLAGYCFADKFGCGIGAVIVIAINLF
jgi:hypothetical protein